MVQLHDLIPEAELAQALSGSSSERLVTRKTSPDGSKHLYLYSPLAMYRGVWNAATMNARGLVTDANTGEVLARPFPKFFNYGDPNIVVLSPDAPVEATDKMDGSLAILLPDETLVSKGSFTSHVARHATKLYTDRYKGKWERRPELTYLFEDIFPKGRIVLDYHGLEDLALLGAVVTETGELLGPAELPEWIGPRTEILPATTLSEALALPDRDNAEGMVLRILDGSGRQVKLKQSDYKALHAVVADTSSRTLWEALAVRDMLDAGVAAKHIVARLGVSPERIERARNLGDDWETGLSERVPDEFHQWMKDTLQRIRDQFRELKQYLLSEAAKASALGLPRKELVDHLRGGDYRVSWNVILSVISRGGELDDNARGAIWKLIYPEADRLGWTPPEV